MQELMIFKEVVNNHPNNDNHECNVKSVEINGCRLQKSLCSINDIFSFTFQSYIWN